MSSSRRAFLAGSASALAATVAGRMGRSAASGVGAAPRPAQAAPEVRVRPSFARAEFGPWLDVDAAALRHNARQLSRLAGGRPLYAVAKNNAYGLGIERVGPMLESAPEVEALAVVKPDEALALRAAGVRKPVLLMGLASDEEAVELAASAVRLAPYADDAASRFAGIARRVGRPVRIHLDIDTGMNRIGLPYHRAASVIEALAQAGGVHIEGAFTTFTEDDAFDAEQLARFTDLTRTLAGRGLELGRLHAASSHALFFRPDAYLDLVRPGLAVYGAHPAGADGRGRSLLRPAFRLAARVVRVERLRPGDTVSYGRGYTAERPTWIATLPVGHADGYPRRAVDGGEVLIGGRTCRVIGAVSASHTIVEVGEQRTVEVGADATLVGPDHPAVHPNTLAERAGISVYDVLMHLSARLPARPGG